ncbi:MAG: glycosyltransferase family 2 protein [Bacteroidota bacterium]
MQPVASSTSVTPAQRQRLGEYLVEAGMVQPWQIQQALQQQAVTGERLGKILLASGYVHRLDLYRALSDLWELPFVLLTQADIDEAVPVKIGLPRIRRLNAFPYQWDGHTMRVAITEYPSPETQRELYELFPNVQHFEYAVTTEWDIDWALREVFKSSLIKGSTYALFMRHPQESAYMVFTRGQYITLASLVMLFIVCLYFAPQATFIGTSIFINVVFFVAVAFKVIVSLAGARIERVQPVTDAEVASLRDEDLPFYTILLPVYKEANIIGLLMDNLSTLDYPKEKLEILVLIEEDDPETLEAAKAARPPDNVQFVIIPDSQPKTKPKACNLGLYFARGEYLVIYDAEDRPEPDQLKKALILFQKGDPSLVVVQGALNYFNSDYNFLTRMFTLEYSYWFDYMLPGLDVLNLPTPLGGTSNHFRTDRLRELAGWDPFNVTEDADLGIRASMRNYTVGIVNSTTYEEANSQVGNWIRQRSRWIKGYMQTTLVHTRNPMKLVRTVGLKNALSFFLLVGGTPLTFLLAPLLWIPFILWIFFGSDSTFFFPTFAVYIAAFNLLIGNGLAIYLNMLAVFRRKLYWLVPFALLNPFYWFLHSYAAYKALIQLFTKPFYWEKTVHGLTGDHTTTA